MAVQLRFSGVLLPGYVQNGMCNSCVVPSRLFSVRFVSIQEVQPRSSTHTVTAWTNSRFILTKRSDIHNLSMAFTISLGVC